MENTASTESSNTILLVIIIIILLIGGAFWWYRNYGTPEPEPNGGLQINIGAEGSSAPPSGSTQPPGSY